MSKNYWFKKNLLITGSTGFVGSHLAKRLQAAGANVYGLSKSRSGKNLLKADIINFSPLEKFVKEKRITLFFHLAGESLVEAGQSDPYKTLRTNIEGTLNLLEIARKNNFEKVVLASTSHVYGKNRVPFREEYSPRPTRPYETSKACTDLIALAYAKTYHLPVLIARFVNIYGPGDLNFNRLIPKTMRTVLSGFAPAIWGGSATRDYLYIDDAVNAYLKLAMVDLKAVGSSRIFNFGGENCLPVVDLVKKIIVLSGKKLPIKKERAARKEEVSVQYVSWSKAKKILNWQVKINLDEGLKRTFKWYASYLQIKNA